MTWPFLSTQPPVHRAGSAVEQEQPRAPSPAPAAAPSRNPKPPARAQLQPWSCTGNMLQVSVIQKGKEALNSFSLKTAEVPCKFQILEAQGVFSNSFSWVSGSRRGTSSLAEAAPIPPETTDIK